MVTTVKRFTQHEGYATQATTDERLQSAVRDEIGSCGTCEESRPCARGICCRKLRAFGPQQMHTDH